MTQTLTEWRERLQQKLMAAIDAAWELIEADDLAGFAKARLKLKACADLAAAARKLLTMSPAPRTPRGTVNMPVSVEAPPRKLDALRGGGRARL